MYSIGHSASGNALQADSTATSYPLFVSWKGSSAAKKPVWPKLAAVPCKGENEPGIGNAAEKQVCLLLNMNHVLLTASDCLGEIMVLS